MFAFDSYSIHLQNYSNSLMWLWDMNKQGDYYETWINKVSKPLHLQGYREQKEQR